MNRNSKMRFAMSVVATLGACAQDGPERNDETAVDAKSELVAKARFARTVTSAAEADAARVPGIPTFQGSFTVDGASFTYTMAGGSPAAGGVTTIPAIPIFLDFTFEGTQGEDGAPVVIRSSEIVDDVIGSPAFIPFDAGNGRAQYADSVQRATFFATARADWHTLIAPVGVRVVHIDVPADKGVVLAGDNGHPWARVDFDFLSAQLATISSQKGVRPDQLPIFVSHNVLGAVLDADGNLIAVNLAGTDARDVVVDSRGRHAVQTQVWSSWLDSDLFGVDDPFFPDATSLTGILEGWMTNPFGTNTAPFHTHPIFGTCANAFELDPLLFASFPVTLHGRSYNANVNPTLEWLSRETPSSAFRGAYSWPDPSVLPAPAQSCTP